MRELVQMRSMFRLDPFTQSSPILRTRSLMQGCSCAPKLFNKSLDVPAGKFVRQAGLKKWGISINKKVRVSLVLFADNFWLFAKSKPELETMYEYWVGLLSQGGWSVPHDEAVWATTLPDEVCSEAFKLGTQFIVRRKRDEPIKILGTMVQLSGSFEAEIDFRIARVWTGFFRYRDTLCNRNIPLSMRFHFLNMMFASVGGWCSGTWTPTKQQLRRLNGVQLKMLRKMLRLPRKPWESDHSYFRRSASIFKGLRKKHRLLTWESIVNRSIYAWAGHVHRIATYDECRLTCVVQRWRDRAFLKSQEKLHGTQGHGRRFKAWRWETPCYKYFESNFYNKTWHEAALDKKHWDSLLDQMTLWRNHNR